MKSIHKILAFLILTLSMVFEVEAQNFEGSIQFQLFSKSEGSNQLKEDGQFFMHFAPNRIMINNQSNYNFTSNPFGMGDVSGLLLREDQQDFVIVDQENKTALIVPKSSIDAFISFMDNMSDDDDEPIDENATELANSLKKNRRNDVKMNIAGEEAMLTVYSQTNEVGKEMTYHVWTPTSFRVNWGLLTQPWVKKINKDTPSDIITYFKEGNIPLRVEMFESGERVGYIECISIEKKKLPASLTQIPAGYERTDLSGLIFKSLMGN